MAQNLPPLEPLQVCVAVVPLGAATYERPCVVVDVTAKTIGLAAISSKTDLYRRGEHFPIPDDHPDFRATGLVAASYVIGSPVFDAQPSQVVKVIGRLQGQLARDFTRWMF
jgi:hypothetical protein